MNLLATNFFFKPARQSKNHVFHELGQVENSKKKTQLHAYQTKDYFTMKQIQQNNNNGSKDTKLRKQQKHGSSTIKKNPMYFSNSKHRQ